MYMLFCGKREKGAWPRKIFLGSGFPVKSMCVLGLSFEAQIKFFKNDSLTLWHQIEAHVRTIFHSVTQ